MMNERSFYQDISNENYLELVRPMMHVLVWGLADFYNVEVENGDEEKARYYLEELAMRSANAHFFLERWFVKCVEEGCSGVDVVEDLSLKTSSFAQLSKMMRDSPLEGREHLRSRLNQVLEAHQEVLTHYKKRSEY
jgi:hypothetical protein